MAGLITLEDILEEIVGEIHDEYDEQEDEMFFQLGDREYVIEGAMNLDDVNERLHTEFTSEDYDSLGGFIIEHLDRLPELNDEVVTEDGTRLVVETLDKNRIESVHVYLPENKADKENTQDEDTDSGADASSEKDAGENLSDKIPNDDAIADKKTDEDTSNPDNA